MAILLDLTPMPVTVTIPASGQWQSLAEALDISGIDVADLHLEVLDAPGGVTLTFGVATGMQKESEAGWIAAPAALFDFEPLTGGQSTVRRFDEGLLQLLRWRFTASAAGGTVTFSMRGMGRRLGPADV